LHPRITPGSLLWIEEPTIHQEVSYGLKNPPFYVRGHKLIVNYLGYLSANIGELYEPLDKEAVESLGRLTS
jgi:hypothetical protein